MPPQDFELTIQIATVILYIPVFLYVCIFFILGFYLICFIAIMFLDGIITILKSNLKIDIKPVFTFKTNGRFIGMAILLGLLSLVFGFAGEVIIIKLGQNIKYLA